MNRATQAAILGIVLGASLTPHAPAQEPAPSPTNSRFWKAKLPGGEYLVLLDAIRFVSLHEYIVDGGARVAEVNIATQSSALARFYHLEPATPQSPSGLGQSTISFFQEKAQEAVTRLGAEEAHYRVVKTYPAATHAHTIEYRLPTRQDLDNLYRHVQRAWTTGQGGTWEL